MNGEPVPALDYRRKAENLLALLERSGPHYHRALVALGYGCAEASAIEAVAHVPE